MTDTRKAELAALRLVLPEGARILSGSVMLGKHTTQGGKPCTMIAGVLVGTPPIDGTDHQAMLVDIVVIPRSRPQVVQASPEDFIENPSFPIES